MSCGMLESAGGSGTLDTCGLLAWDSQAVSLHTWRLRGLRGPFFWQRESWRTLRRLQFGVALVAGVAARAECRVARMGKTAVEGEDARTAGVTQA
jgi:hypothetical protein